MLHALFWAWLAGCVVLTCASAATALHLDDFHYRRRGTRWINHVCFGWFFAGIVVLLIRGTM